MQQKKWWILLVIVIIVIVMFVVYEENVSTTRKSELKLRGVRVEHTDNTSLAHINWIKTYPQLAKVESNNQTAVIDKLRTSESISQLIGSINNPYGVRDDILAEIVKMVPESNPLLLEATVKGAYYYNLAYFSLTDSDKLKFIRVANSALGCVFDLSQNFNDGNDIYSKVNYLMSDTDIRSQYRHHIDSTAFAYQVTSSIDNNSAKECREGKF